VFATAAFRFGHTLVANHLESYNRLGSRVAALPITHTQFAPYAMYDNTTVETFVRGLTTQPAQAFDTAFAPELTGHLFQEEGESFGMDLVALNIQRGRDHGLAGYMAWRALCDLPTVTSWKELAMIFPSMVVARLQALYKSVDDIDIFVGGILEVSYTYLVTTDTLTGTYPKIKIICSLPRNLQTAHCWGQRFSVSLVINLHGE
jgi:peroxidase